MTPHRKLLLPLFFCVLIGAQRVGRAQDELIELVTGLLKEQDKDLRALAFDQIRKEAKGETATRKFAELLPQFPAETQIGLLSALAERDDSAAAPAVRNLLAATGDEAVRIAALKALGALGSRDDLPVLVATLSAKSEALRSAAEASLVQLPGDASEGIVTEAKRAPSATRTVLLRILTARRARDAIPLFLESAADDDATVRQTAVNALAELASAEHVPGMISLVLETLAGRQRDAVEKAIVTVCNRAENKPERAAPVITAMKSLKKGDRAILYSTLGRVGTAAALKVVDEATASADEELRKASLRALANWPDGMVVSRLLRVARTDDDEARRTLALQALIRIAPLADERTDGRRLDTLRTVFLMCTSDGERNQVLDRAKAIRSIDTLRFLIPFLEQPAHAQEACLTVVELAHHRGLRESHKDEFHRALDQVLTISKDATVIDRAQRYKAGQTWVRPKKT